MEKIIYGGKMVNLLPHIGIESSVSGALALNGNFLWKSEAFKVLLELRALLMDGVRRGERARFEPIRRPATKIKLLRHRIQFKPSECNKLRPTCKPDRFVGAK